MLRQRILSSVTIIPVLFLCIWYGDPWFSIIVSIAALLGIVEFYTLLTIGGLKPLTYLGVAWTVLFLFNAYYASYYDSVNMSMLAALGLAIAAAIIFAIILVFSRSARDKVIVNWAWSTAGVLYIGWLLSYWILLMNSETWDGRDWVLLAIFSTFAVDTTAYFTGRAWGRHKMAPVISPKKTWEGALGGLAGALASVFLLSVILDIDYSYGELIFIGFAVGILSQVGDLLESKIKRTIGVKESGTLIPGHGGILDRLDSIIFSGVVVYYCLRWFTG